MKSYKSNNLFRQHFSSNENSIRFSCACGHIVQCTMRKMKLSEQIFVYFTLFPPLLFSHAVIVFVFVFGNNIIERAFVKQTVKKLITIQSHLWIEIYFMHAFI